MVRGTDYYAYSSSDANDDHIVLNSKHYLEVSVVVVVVVGLKQLMV